MMRTKHARFRVPAVMAVSGSAIALASLIARCSTLSVPARHTLTLTPYFSSKGLTIAGRSFSAIVV